MEKKELLQNLYDLRTALLLMAVKCDDLGRRNHFDRLCKEEKMYSSDQEDPYVTSVYQYNAEPLIDYDPDSKESWPAIKNWIKMYGLAENHILIEGLSKFVPDYVFLFDHLSPKPKFIKFWKKAHKYQSSTESQYFGYVYYPQKFFGINENIELAMDNFNLLNVNVLKIKKKICEDALVNKKSPLLRYYKQKEIYRYFLPRIEFLIKNRHKTTATAEYKCKQKYGVIAPRTKQKIAIDKKITNELSKATHILEEKYSFVSRTDWRDIDCFIYFLETGRADTMKEALNLNDLKKYKDEIVASVDRVNRTVIQGITALRNDLSTYFNTLFSHLDSLNNSLIDIADELRKNRYAISYSSNQICRAIDNVIK